MELAASITQFKHEQTLSTVQMRVAKEMLDVQRADGTAALQLLELVSRSASLAGDALTAAATGLGGKLDTIA